MDSIFNKFGIYDFMGIWGPGAIFVTYFSLTLHDPILYFLRSNGVSNPGFSDSHLVIIVYTAIAYMVGVILHELGRLFADVFNIFRATQVNLAPTNTEKENSCKSAHKNFFEKITKGLRNRIFNFGKNCLKKIFAIIPKKLKKSGEKFKKFISVCKKHFKKIICGMILNKLKNFFLRLFLFREIRRKSIQKINSIISDEERTAVTFEKAISTIKFKNLPSLSQVDKYHSIYALARSLSLTFLLHLFASLFFVYYPHNTADYSFTISFWYYICDCVLAFLFILRAYRYFYSWVKSVYIQYHYITNGK